MTEEQLKKLLDQQAKAITDNTDDQIARLFTHMNERFDQVHQEIHSVRQDVNEVRTIVDGIAKNLDTFQQEQTIINARTESKLNQLGEATSIKWATE